MKTEYFLKAPESKMKRFTIHILFCVFVIMNFISDGYAQEKLAQTGFQFLTVISDAKAAALGSTVTAIESQSNALFFNPATMGFDTSLISASFSLNQWIADINHQNMSIAIQPFDGILGVFGFSLQLVDYGEILGTRVADNEQGYIDVGKIDASALAVGFGYAKAISEQFSVGGQVKWVRQSLGETFIQLDSANSKTVTNELSVMAFDFGTLFKTGFESLAFGMSIRNFSTEVKYVEEGFQLPLRFTLGISMDLVDFTNFDKDNNSLMLSVESINDRSHAQQIGFGLEYEFLKMFSLRGGYILENDENSFNLGLGISWYGLSVDYAYSPYGLLGDINRFSVRFSY